MSCPKMRKAKKYYLCPSCGAKRLAYEHWAVGWQIDPHGLGVVKCPGGPINRDTDGAKTPPLPEGYWHS